MRPIRYRFVKPSLRPRLPRALENGSPPKIRNLDDGHDDLSVRRTFIGNMRLVGDHARRYGQARGSFSMKCQQCQHENSAKAKFCEECAAPLPRTCDNCGSQVSLTAKFCPQCGHPLGPVRDDPRFASPKSYTPQHLADKILTSRTALEGERKQVTVLFADIKGSMELLADRDPEDAQKLLDPVLERMIEAVHRYEGTVNRVMGDGIMGLFGAPIAHEDHAVRACYAALRMLRRVNVYADEIQRGGGTPVQIRVGLNSGEIVVCAIGNDLHMDYTVVGQTAHLAARLEQLANPGSVLTTADTLRLAEGYIAMKPLGLVSVKGLPNQIQIYEVTGAGDARILSVNAQTRSRAAPDIPTSIEAGLPGMVAQTTFGIFAPAGTPPA